MDAESNQKITINFELGRDFSLRNISPLSGVTGLYFIYSQNIKIKYPFKESRLLYIGMSEKYSNSIGKRLQGHFDGSSGNAGLLNYASVDELKFTYINFEMLRNIWKLRIEDLESYFILDFVSHHGVYPICNNKSGYNIQNNIFKDHLIDIRWENFE